MHVLKKFFAMTVIFDYALKLDDYETIGIPEYWIVD